jgi:hypothetical protein
MANPGGITTAPILWLKASDLALADGASVASWAATTGPTYATVTTVNQPIFHTNQINSLPSVRSALNQVLTSSGLSSSSGNYTVMAVMKMSDITSHWIFDAQSGRFAIIPSNSGQSSFYDGAFKPYSTVTAPPTGSFAVWEWVFNGTGSTTSLYINGTQLGSATGYLASSIGGTTSVLGAYDTISTGAQSYLGDLAELTIFPSVLSSGDRSTVRSYLGTRYAISVTGGATASMTASPTSLSASTTGNIVTLTGTATSWVSGTTFSVAGTGASITAQSVNVGAQTATLTVSSGTSATLTYSNSTDSSIANQTVVSTVQILMNNAAILYSPYNWLATSAQAKTINSGAYFKTIFTGTSCTLTTNTSGNSAPYSEFLVRIDGGPFVAYTLATSSPSYVVGTGLVNRAHSLEVVVKSTSETIDRWNTQSTAMIFTSIILDSGATVRLPNRKPYNIIVYGDSITEGVRTLNATAGNDTDRNDATRDYSWLLGEILPAEVGVVGFGATGIINGGSGNVPNLAGSYNFLWSGQARTFSPAPDLVIYNEGTNDGASIQAGMTTMIANMISAAPSCKQLLLRPFGGQHAGDLQVAVTAAANTKVVYGDTTGFWTSSDSSDGLHPFDYSHIMFLAPKVAALAAPLLGASGTTVTLRSKGSRASTKGGH